MSIIADGLLIATCLTSAVYCFVLARRLKQFSNTEEGIGKQIIQLTKTLEETRAALKEAQAGAKAESEVLAREVTQARKLAAQLRSMMEHAPAPAAAASPRAARKSFETDGRPSANVEGTANFVAAAAVELEEPDSSEDEDLDPAELDVNALLQASEGEQQLGFLPDIQSADDAESDIGADGDVDDFDDNVEDDTDDDQSSDLEHVGEAAAVAAEGDPGNLLKVERMAL